MDHRLVRVRDNLLMHFFHFSFFTDHTRDFHFFHFSFFTDHTRIFVSRFSILHGPHSPAFFTNRIFKKGALIAILNIHVWSPPNDRDSPQPRSFGALHQTRPS